MTGQSGDEMMLTTAASFRTAEFRRQYGLSAIKAEYAYARGYTGEGVVVALVDSGIARNHPEFSGGKLIRGRDVVNNDNDPYNDIGEKSHGSRVAGVIAANRDGVGIHGVAYGAQIMPVKYDNQDPGLISAFRYARENGAFVFSTAVSTLAEHSFSEPRLSASELRLTYPRSARGYTLQPLFDEFFQIAVAGGIIVWATGNEGWNSETGLAYILNNARTGYLARWTTSQIVDRFGASTDIDALDRLNQAVAMADLPNRFPQLKGHWLAVGAVDENNVITDFSNGCGSAKDWCLVAPGDDIRTTNLDGYELTDGTSFSEPHVTGAIAILKSAFPTMTAPEIVDLLLSTATDLGASGVDDVYGHGLVNLDEATRPQGAARLASSMTRRGKKGGVMLVSDSRIESSSAFGGAFDETSAQLGAIDSFDRVFPLPLSHLADEDSDAVFPIAHSAVAAIQTFEDEKGFWSRQTADGESLAFGWRGKQGRHRFSVQAEAADDKKHLRELSEEFNAFASSNALSSDNLASAEWRMDINDAFQTAMRFEMGDGDDSKTHRAAFRASWQASSSLQMAAEIGNYLEKGSLLGAKFRGGLKVGGGSTAYGKLSAHYQLGKWNAVASATKGITRANDLGGIVQSVTSLHSAGFHFGIERESNRGAMRFQVSRDLSVQRGALDLSYVGGYEGNDYRIDSARINLAGNPPTRFAFLFQKHLGICKLKRGAKLSVGVGAEFIANSPRRNYQDSDTILSAAFRCGF